MKTAEQIAEKLWEKYKQPGSFDGFNGNIICRLDFLSAIRAFKEEYGAAVRQRAAGVVEEVTLEWVKSPPFTVRKPTASVYRDAIERMEIP